MNYTKLIITIVSLVLVASITLFALLKGVNGYVLVFGLILIGGLGGFQVNELIAMIKNKDTNQPK